MNLVYKIALVVTAFVCAMIIVWDLRDADAAQQTPPGPSTPAPSHSAAAPDTHVPDAQNASVSAGGTTAVKPSAPAPAPAPALRPKGTPDAANEPIATARVTNQIAPASGKSQQASSPVAAPSKSPATTPSTPSTALPPNVVGQSGQAVSNSAASSAPERISTIAAIDRPATTKSNTPASTGTPGEGDHLGSFFSPQPGDDLGNLPAGQIPASYTIEAGDSFSAIAQKVYHREAMWVSIRDANPKVDPRHLTVGQVIKLPQPGAAAGATVATGPTIQETAQLKTPATVTSPTNKSVYVVKPGDTLSSIAREVYRDGGAWRTLYKANRSTIGANPNRLARGLKLVIPPAGRDG